eukprot:3299317-Pyramimonas_sp.AAC.1
MAPRTPAAAWIEREVSWPFSVRGSHPACACALVIVTAWTSCCCALSGRVRGGEPPSFPAS